MNEEYGRYLCSREWAVKKRAVRQRCGGVCERCNANAMDHVHHLTYARKYKERLSDLQGLCKGCHDFIHAISDTDPKRVASDEAQRLHDETIAARVIHKAILRNKRKAVKKFSRSKWERFVWLKSGDSRMTDGETTEVLKAVVNFARWRDGIDIPRSPSRFDYIWQEEFRDSDRGPK